MRDVRTWCAVLVVGALAAGCDGAPRADPALGDGEGGPVQPPPNWPAPTDDTPPPVPQPHRLGFTNAGALGLEILESDRRPSASGPKSPDVLVAWALVAREPRAAEAFTELKEGGLFGFHVDALLCLGALDDPAEFKERFARLLEDAPAWKPVAPAADGTLSPAARLARETLTLVEDYAGDAEIETAALRALLDEGDVKAFRVLAEESAPRARLVGLLGLAVADRAAARAKMAEIRDAVGPMPPPGDSVSKRTWSGDEDPEMSQLVLSAAGRLALDVLSQSTCFMSSMVGDGGGTPPPVYALRVILEEADAEPALRWLAGQGHAAARLYAACGLRAAGSPRAAGTIAALRERSDSVGTLSGCIRCERPVAEVARSIERGDERDIAGR